MRNRRQYPRDVAAYLLANGARVNEKNMHADTPAHLALRLPWSEEIIDLLAENGADVSTIYLAAFRGNLLQVKRLLEMGTDLNICERAGFTPLHTAVSSGKKKMVEFLISKGADVNSHDKAHHTPAPLFYAAVNGHKDRWNY